MSYSFRIRFHLPNEYRIGINEPEVIIGNYLRSDILLKSKQVDKPINESDILILRGDNYASQEQVENAGLHCKDILMLAFAQNHIGADFGYRAPTSFVTTAGLERFTRQRGVPILNDVHGLMTFKSEKNMQFAAVHAQPVVTRNKERFMTPIKLAFERNSSLSDQQRIAFDIYGAAFFQKSIDARFLMLMVAFETLLEQSKRSEKVQKHVAELIRLTRASSELPPDDRNSIIGSLELLNRESIGQAGRKLVKCLGNRTYAGQKPHAFFDTCYAIRSKLVHGHVPRPKREDIVDICSSLELFVGDLISYQLLNL